MTRWKADAPRAPGFYWYKHRGVNSPEPVKITADGHVLFVGDWRVHRPEVLVGALWGDPLVPPERTDNGGV